jgi:hypothetical protein
MAPRPATSSTFQLPVRFCQDDVLLIGSQRAIGSKLTGATDSETIQMVVV